MVHLALPSPRRYALLLLLVLMQVAADCSEPQAATLHSTLQWGHLLWQKYFDNTMQVAGSTVNETFRIGTLEDGGRFAFFKSPVRWTYLEWQTLATGNRQVVLPRPFYMPLNQSRFAEELCTERIAGPVFVYRGFVPEKFQYGHILMDVLPLLVYVLTQHPAAKIAVQLDPDSLVKQFMEWFLPDFFGRLLFVPVETVICVEKSLMFLQPGKTTKRPESLRISELSTQLHRFSLRTHPQFKVNKVIYYQRQPGSVSHSRLLDKAESGRVLARAREILKHHNRPEQIQIFTGKSHGVPLTFKDQYQLFNSAYLVFGIHGAGMANVLYMQSSCEQRPVVIEFMCSEDTADVAGCFLAHVGLKHQPRPQSYWRLYGGASWLRYFIVWLLRRDDHPSGFARVDVDGFARALNQSLEFAGGPLE